MLRKVTLAVLLMMAVITGLPCAQARTGNVVDVRIVSDHGNVFRKYRVHPRVYQESHFFYVEAVKGDRYSIQVTNKSDKRIGVVIAVDGRNIIDGEKSDLKQSERMYIVGPYGSNTFEGWRTGIDGQIGFTSPSRPNPIRKKCLPMPRQWGPSPLPCTGKSSPDSFPEPENHPP